jgi:class 3 adenylate cyclase
MSTRLLVWNWSLLALIATATVAALFATTLQRLLGQEASGAARWLPAFLAGWAILTAAGTASSKLLAPKGSETKPLERFCSALSLLLLVGVLGLLSRALLGFAPRGSETAFAGWLDGVFHPASSAIGDAQNALGVPADLAGIPTAPFSLLMMMFVARNAVAWRVDMIHRLRRQGRLGGPVEAPERTPLDDRAARAKAVERRLAVAAYAEAKSLLEQSRVDVTFLSLDVAGSAALKQGEDPYVVEQSFAAYRKLVERVLRQHGAWKQVWTPDGQMAAFRSPQAGVECAKDVLRHLPAFNREQSQLKRPFRVRAGANVGSLSTDEHTPLEEISDYAIDVTGHLQKHADAGALWISEELYHRLEDPAGFAAAATEVDGARVFAWTKDT